MGLKTRFILKNLKIFFFKFQLFYEIQQQIKIFSIDENITKLKLYLNLKKTKICCNFKVKHTKNL